MSEPPVAPDDTPTRLPMSLQDRVEFYLKVTERAKSGLVREIWAEVSRLREALVTEEAGNGLLKRALVAADADVSRLQQSLTEKEDLLKQIMRTVHVGTFQAAPVAVEGLSESVSRLQQENALLRRSLDVIGKLIDERDQQIRELNQVVIRQFER